MPKEPCKAPTKQSGVRVEVEVEGYSVFISIQDLKTGAGSMVTLHRSAAAALWALLGACDGGSDDAGAMQVQLRGSISPLRKATQNEDGQPSTIPPSL